MSELRECPLCRGKAQYESKGTARRSMIIVCEYCGLRCESGDVYGLTPVESYRWNTRHADAVREAALALCIRIDAEGGHGQRVHALVDALRAALAQDGRES